MAVEIKRVAYTFNSALEDLGVPAYFLECLITRDGETLVDRHESFKSKDDFLEAVESVVPMIEPPKSDDWDEMKYLETL